MEENQNDILQYAPANAPSPREKRRGRGVSILLAIFLFVSLVSFGEKLIFDLNKNINPHTCPIYSSSYGYDYNYVEKESMDEDARLELCGTYKITRLFIILAIVLPVLLGAFFLFIKYGFQSEGKHMPLAVAYFAFSSWLLGHLIIETAHFLVRGFDSLWIYVLFLVEIAILTALVFVIQKRRHESHQL